MTNLEVEAEKFAKGDKVIIHGFDWGLRVLVLKGPIKKNDGIEVMAISRYMIPEEGLFCR